MTYRFEAYRGYRARLDTLSFDVPNESGAAFEQSITAEAARWAQVVEATGFRAAD